jgi:sugar phosphate isomerase/epimerase
MPSDLSRRAILAGGAARVGKAMGAPPASKLKVAIFSKHLHFLRGDEMAAGAAEIGFDGVDLTVRKGGHVEPENVRRDLPALAAAVRKHGLEMPMITTDIVDTETPRAEEILGVMADLGIRYYRWGGFKYTAAESYPAQLERIKPRIARLAALNARHKVCAIYHTHSGRDLVGAPIWDLYLLLKDFDPHTVAVNYDVAHATIEGGFGGWIDSFRLTAPRLGGIAVKDFVWAPDAKGDWHPEWKPLGQGMVRFPEFFGMVARSGFSGPLQLHVEHPLGGAESGKTALTIPREQVYAAIKRDLAQLRAWLAEAGL